MMQFEWDEGKNRNNIIKHGISFDHAVRVFLDPMLYEQYDNNHSGYNQYGIWEDRFIALGLVEEVLHVVYAIRERGNEEVVRIISARVAVKEEIDRYTKWTHRNP